ncbi:MAG: hypothetical protein V3U03_08940 [Myxococcota bacterium]
MLAAASLAAVLLAPALAEAQVVDLLPDVITVRERLFETAIDERENQTLLRLSNATPNIGAGPLETLPRDVFIDGREKVNQRIYRSDGTWWGREAGTFTFHRPHDHIHFDDWAVYPVRVIAEDGGVGEVVAEGDKTSFCTASPAGAAGSAEPQSSITPSARGRRAGVRTPHGGSRVVA